MEPKKRSAASELSASEKVILGVKDTEKVFWSASFKRYYIKVKYGTNYLTINGKKFYVGNESPTESNVYFYIYPAGMDIVTFLLSFEQSSHVGSSKMEYMLLAEYEGKHKIVIRNVPDNKAILRLFEECDYTIIESEYDLW